MCADMFWYMFMIYGIFMKRFLFLVLEFFFFCHSPISSLKNSFIFIFNCQKHIIQYSRPMIGSLNVVSAPLTLPMISLVSGFDGGGGGGGGEGRTCG